MKFDWHAETLEVFWSFIAARQTAFARRASGHAPPWTTDPIVQSNHFTNVYRELDPGTRWLVNSVLSEPRYTESDRAFLTLAYRLFGTEEVFEYLGVHEGEPRLLPDTFDERWLATRLILRMEKGRTAFTPAYMVSNYGRAEPKPIVIADVLGTAAVDWPYVWPHIRDAECREDVVNALTSVHGIGKFIAFQTMVDLCYPLPLLKGQKILNFSNDDWVVAGPGAIKGLQLLIPDHKWKKGDDNRAIADLVKKQYIPLQARGMPWLVDLKNKPIKIDRSNMQNCLCEFSKYWRLRTATKSAGGRKRGFAAEASHKRDRQIPMGSHLLVGMALQTTLDT